jgi:hypothetical protein
MANRQTVDGPQQSPVNPSRCEVNPAEVSRTRPLPKRPPPVIYSEAQP